VQKELEFLYSFLASQVFEYKGFRCISSRLHCHPAPSHPLVTFLYSPNISSANEAKSYRRLSHSHSRPIMSSSLIANFDHIVLESGPHASIVAGYSVDAAVTTFAWCPSKVPTFQEWTNLAPTTARCLITQKPERACPLVRRQTIL
jgi:hypothetical protein